MRGLKAQILEFDKGIIAWHRSNATSKRLDAIPGVGPALATALVASVADAKTFRSGRDFSAWVGLVPKQNSSGGKDKLGRISKQGDRYLRSLFTAGARRDPLRQDPWHEPSALAHCVVGTAPHQGRSHRTRQ
ncbi:IS110 family transposase [Bradyrhizobium sp. 168]|nr:IS110 family transposase [Bradyrhizobium sp. 168]